jgi:hypothetical protein
MTKLKRLGLVFLMMYVAAIFMGLSWCGHSISILLPQLLLGVVLIVPEPLLTVLGIAHLIKSVLYENAQMYAQGVGTVFAVTSLVLSYTLYIAFALVYVCAKRRWLARVCLCALAALLAFACYFATQIDPTI